MKLLKNKLRNTFFVRVIFRKFLKVLKKADVYKVHRLINPDTGEEVSGFLDSSVWWHDIFISPDKDNPAVIILIHELLHAVFPKMTEEEIARCEKTVYYSLSSEQIADLEFHIPKKWSRKKPQKI